MNSVPYSICETQGDIYRYVNRSTSLELAEFSAKYLHSRFCRVEMDALYSHFQLADAEECLDFILPEIQVVKQRTREFDDAFSYWVGFMYRYLFFSLQIPSAEIADHLTFSDMVLYYPGLHTVDDDMAIDIIRHDFFKDKKER